MPSVLTSPSIVSVPSAAPLQGGGAGFYKVTLTLDPTALAKLSSCYIEFLLGPNGSPSATAKLTNFAITGGGILDPWFNHGASGNFQSGITMQCRPRSAAPQMLGVLDPGTSQISFNLALDTKFTVPDWFTLWIHDSGGVGFPTTAAGRPGLFAAVSWSAARIFSPSGYAGNGVVDGIVSDTGFNAVVQ